MKVVTCQTFLNINQFIKIDRRSGQRTLILTEIIQDLVCGLTQANVRLIVWSAANCVCLRLVWQAADRVLPA